MGGENIQTQQPSQPVLRRGLSNPSAHRRRRRWLWLALLAVILLVAGPTAFAAPPTSPLYPIQRLGENLTTNLAPAQKDFFRAVFAARRVRDAKYLIERLSTKSVQEQSQDTERIKEMLKEYRFTFEQITNDLGRTLDSGKQPSQSFFTTIERASTRLYVDISDQRLEAPAAAQAEVLHALETAQNNLATIADVLQHPPISTEDAKQLTAYVAAGLMTKDDMTGLMSDVTSNRQWLEDLRTEVKLGRLPASVLPAIQYDVVAKHAPEQLDHFQATVNFDEMRKIALLIRAITPTANEKKQIQTTLANYVPGQSADAGADAHFTRPILYGLYLAQHLPKDLQHLDVDQLQPGRRLFYETWKPLAATKTTDIKELYNQSLSLVDRHVARNIDLLQQIEFEVLSALQSDVVYMALPPGWTKEHVITIRPAFEQLIKDVQAATELQTQTAATTKDLTMMTTTLAAPLASPDVDAIRQETRQKLVAIRKELTTMSVSPAIPNDALATIQQNMAAMKQEVNASIQSVVATVSAPTETLNQQVKELQAAFTAALAAANQAVTDVQTQVTLNARLSDELKTTVTALSTTNVQNKADLERRLASLETASGVAADSLKKDIDGIIASADKNTAALTTQLNDALKVQAALKVSLHETIQAQADHAAELHAQLELSASARLALKVEVTAVIHTVKAAQAAAVAKLEKTIADSDTLQAQASGDITATIAGLTTAQTQLLAGLQAQVDNHDALKSQVEASLVEIHAAAKNLSEDISALKPAQADLKTFVESLKHDLDASVANVQTNATATAQLRTDLEQSVASIQASQAQATANLTSGLESLGQELRQSINDVRQAQTATAVGLANLGTSVEQAKANMANLAATQASAGVSIQAHSTAISDLSGDLEQSLSQLQQAQAQTQTELNTVKNDVNTLKQSVQDVQAAQAAANEKIDQLLAASVNWTQVPSSVTIDQSVLDNLKAELDAEFTAKSDALEAQYQQYHQQLNVDLSKLKSETDAQILRLQQEADTLKQQIQQLQQTTTSTTTNTTTTTTNTSTGIGL